MIRKILYLSTIVLTLNLITTDLHAQEIDPFDHLNKELLENEKPTEIDEDIDKSSDELIIEALILQQDERLLDARTKLLKALKKNPKEFKAHIALSTYYLIHVGHFRLALKYAKQALNLLKEKFGEPPYLETLPYSYHADILNLISQCRLNLDDYEGALQPLLDFERYGYQSPYLASSKAWILMKQGKLDEAIKVARLGLVFGGNIGSTQNVLGILLSMTGQTDAAINVFKKTIKYELALGENGQPATPLNNVGEIYRESFKEEKAKESWNQAIRLPDGCEHVLPSMNLALVLMEETNYNEAASIISNFESCVAQYPLRNGEEHRGLVNLAKGRIALYKGKVDEALNYLEEANKNQQWFGKIGTSQNDMKAAVLSSLAQALKVKNNFLKFTESRNFENVLIKQKTIFKNTLKSWWYKRRARQILIEDLNFIEDLYVRHTDSMLDYPALGFVLSDVRPKILKRRIASELKTDTREGAKIYYDTYIAESLLKNAKKEKAIELLINTINKGRPLYDRAIRKHAMALFLLAVNKEHELYPKFAHRLYEMSKPAPRMYGIRMPVNGSNIPKKIIKSLNKTGFIVTNKEKYQFTIKYEQDLNSSDHVLTFKSDSPVIGNVKVTSQDVTELVNNFSLTVFQDE